MHDHASFYCPYCTYHHRTVDGVARHKKDCKAEKRTVEKMPKVGSVVKFGNVKDIEFKRKSIKVPGTVYNSYRVSTPLKVVPFNIRRKRMMKMLPYILYGR